MGRHEVGYCVGGTVGATGTAAGTGADGGITIGHGPAGASVLGFAWLTMARAAMLWMLCYRGRFADL